MDAAAADPDQEQAYAYLPPQATRGATRMVPTAGRTWQQRRLIRGAGAEARAVGTAWSRLSSQEREAFGSQRGFRAHLEATAMNRAVQSAEAKEEAARQAGRDKANAETQRQAQTQGQTHGTTNTTAAAGTANPSPQEQAVEARAAQLRKNVRDMDPGRRERWIKATEADKGVPRPVRWTDTPDLSAAVEAKRIDASSFQRPNPAAPQRPSGLSYDNQGQVIRNWIGSDAPTQAPPASTNQNQLLEQARRARLQQRTQNGGSAPRSYLSTLRGRVN